MTRHVPVLTCKSQGWSVVGSSASKMNPLKVGTLLRGAPVTVKSGAKPRQKGLTLTLVSEPVSPHATFKMPACTQACRHRHSLSHSLTQDSMSQGAGTRGSTGLRLRCMREQHSPACPPAVALPPLVQVRVHLPQFILLQRFCTPGITRTCRVMRTSFMAHDQSRQVCR